MIVFLSIPCFRISDISIRRKLYEGVVYDDIEALKACLDICEAISYKPECCEVYRDAFRSLTECHPSQIKEALYSILHDAAVSDS